MTPSGLKVEKLSKLSEESGGVFKIEDLEGIRYVWVARHEVRRKEQKSFGIKEIIETTYNFRSPETMYIELTIPADTAEPASYTPRPGPLFEDDYKALAAWLGAIRNVKIISPEATKPSAKQSIARQDLSPR